MKVRISNNNIRFRLKEPEVSLFKNSGVVTETLEFGNEDAEQIKFSLQKTNDEKISVSFQNHHTIISVPAALAEEWTTTELVGFDSVIHTSKGKKICVLVEKDFMCMDGREEDNIGSYPNPLALQQE